MVRQGHILITDDESEAKRQAEVYLGCRETRGCGRRMSTFSIVTDEAYRTSDFSIIEYDVPDAEASLSLPAGREATSAEGVKRMRSTLKALFALRICRRTRMQNMRLFLKATLAFIFESL